MYGQPETPRPEYMQELDESFIKKAVSKFSGNRKEASNAWAAVAEVFFRKDNFHYAMRRYNQAWLLDDTNYFVYWGFWAYALFGQARYVETWEKVKKVREIGSPSFPEKFINELSKKSLNLNRDGKKNNSYSKKLEFFIKLENSL